MRFLPFVLVFVLFFLHSGAVGVFNLAVLKEINPVGHGLNYYAPYIIWNSIVLFAADNGTTGTELWRTDG